MGARVSAHNFPVRSAEGEATGRAGNTPVVEMAKRRCIVEGCTSLGKPSQCSRHYREFCARAGRFRTAGFDQATAELLARKHDVVMVQPLFTAARDGWDFQVLDA